jgi:predicted Zn-ribbon and HTH transcriptional regulator
MIRALTDAIGNGPIKFPQYQNIKTIATIGKRKERNNDKHEAAAKRICAVAENDNEKQEILKIRRNTCFNCGWIGLPPNKPHYSKGCKRERIPKGEVEKRILQHAKNDTKICTITTKVKTMGVNDGATCEQSSIPEVGSPSSMHEGDFMN